MAKGFKEKINKLFSSDIGIDLGTANSLVLVAGHGIVLNEPSVVALNHKTGRVVAIGMEAKQMIGRTPQHITAVRPLVNGVISDFEVTEEMIRYFIAKTQELFPGKLMRPRVVIGVPSQITNVERRAVRDAAKNAGAREVHIIEEPMAAALGIRLPVHEPLGSMIIDIGGGTTDIAVISLGGVVRAKNLHVAGDKLNQDIVTYVRDEFKILLGEKTAEEVKIAIASAAELEQPMEASIRGRDMVTGLPREVVITDADIREAIAPSISMLVQTVKEVLETTPPELISDIMHRGIVLTGGGSLLHGLQKRLANELKIPIYVSEDPLTAVVRGTGIVLEDVEFYRELLVDSDDELPPQ
ncbi:MAG: rod shape-determining protein [Parcubacteria group bacterium RIFOXYD2_FULL_52_8]|nr:MAG: rod shape-determining protein [Parcubacteria group bacterium RIFOXYD2_FULL_52_8]